MKRSRCLSLKFIEKYVLRCLRDESGLAVPMAVSIFAVMMILGFGLYQIVEGEQTLSSRENLAVKTLHIADAGVADYLWHLNDDEEYYETQTHPAQGQDLSGQDRWVSTKGGEYHLEITPPVGDALIITVKCIGRIQNPLGGYVERTISVDLKKRSFVNYVYLTNHETNESTGGEIWWISGDEIFGPLHTNDDLHTQGTPIFHNLVSIGGVLDDHGSPDFQEGYDEHVQPLEFPVSNSKLKTAAQQQGYYYYGYTRITLNSSGTLTIVNNDSSGQTTGPKGTVSLPANGVIYVDGQTRSKGTATNGDLYIAGTLNGRLTIAVKNIVYITGSILYQDTDDDMLGLVAENYVYINHYQGSSDVAPYNITINAAIFAQNHSFGFERYDEGSVKGTLTVNGAIAQQYRGPLGTFQGSQRKTGYVKDYHFDERMELISPPVFIEPVNAGFEQSSWEEITGME